MIKVTGRKTYDAHEGGITQVVKTYLYHDGLACKQSVLTQEQSDYPKFGQYRNSQDNGRTYGEWHEIPKEKRGKFYGTDEVVEDLDEQKCVKVWNPVHKHYISTHYRMYFIDGHDAGYTAFWTGNLNGLQGYYGHQYIRIYKEHEDKHYAQQFLKYEDGADFDPENPRNPEFLKNNEGFCNLPIVLENGDIVVPVSPKISAGCRLAGLDVKEVFPTFSQLFRCVIVARGKYNKETERYDFTFSNPVILNDRQSSRGIDEPVIAELKSGRLLLVMRGSNMVEPRWNTRIAQDAPSYKWYAYSDDGGKTFTAPQPWRFDDGEEVRSSATFCWLFRSQKNGKLYWIGNVTPHAWGNFPRYPLHIGEVDEETGLLKKSTLTVIDTRREGETGNVQLSNFWVTEDRETGIVEVALFKVGQFVAENPFYGEGWAYEIDLGD